MIQQLGSLSAAFGPCVEHHPVDTLVEGDFCINNDPYHGGQHLPDVFIFSPAFLEGELVAFGATVAQGRERLPRTFSRFSVQERPESSVNAARGVILPWNRSAWTAARNPRSTAHRRPGSVVPVIHSDSSLHR